MRARELAKLLMKRPDWDVATGIWHFGGKDRDFRECDIWAATQERDGLEGVWLIKTWDDDYVPDED